MIAVARYALLYHDLCVPCLVFTSHTTKGLTVDMDKGLLFKLSYINRISMPVYRGRTPLNHAEIEVCLCL